MDPDALPFDLIPAEPEATAPASVTPGVPAPQPDLPFTLEPVEETAAPAGPTYGEVAADPQGHTGMMAVAAAFNSRLADALGIGANNLDLIWQKLGGEGFVPGDNPQETADAIKRAAADFGIAADPVDGVMSDLGEGLFTGAAAYAMLGAGAGYLASQAAKLPAVIQQTLPAGTKALTSLAGSVTAHPGIAFTSELGADVGGRVGGRAARGLGAEPGGLGEFAGSLAGSVAGGGLGGTTASLRMGQIAGGATGAIAGAGAGALAGPMGMGPGAVTGWMAGQRAGRNLAARALTAGATEPRPLVTAIDVNAARDYALRAVDADKIAVERELQQAVKAVGGSNDPIAAGQKLWDETRKAYDSAQRRATNLWSKVDQSRPVAVSRLKGFANKVVEDNAKFKAESIPGDVVNKINRLGIKRDPRTGKETFTGQAAMKDLMQIHSSINAELRAGVDNDELRRNLISLDRALMNAIDKQYPADKTLKAAREYSTWLHDQFTRGGLGDFFGRSRKNATYIADPAQRGGRLLRRDKGGKQVFTASEELKRPQLAQAATSYARSVFQSIAEQQGPEAGAKFMASPYVRNFMKDFPTVYPDWQLNTDRLKSAVEMQQRVQKSVLTKFSETDPQTAISGMFNGPQKVQRARELVTRMADDPDNLALPALKTGVIEEVWRRGGGDPARIQRLLGERDTAAVMKTVLGPHDYGRLNRILRIASDMKTGKGGLGSKAQSLFARIIGASFGKAVGVNTLQGTAAYATLGDLTMRGLTGVALPEFMIARAVVDPKWERVLLMNSPRDIAEFRRQTDIIRALAVAINGTEDLIDLTQTLPDPSVPEQDPGLMEPMP